MLVFSGSLPGFWASFFRPLPDGRRGLDHARRLPKFAAPVLAAAVDRLENARGAFVEVVQSNAAKGRLVARDLFDGATLEVRAPALAGRVREGARGFAVLVEIGDGTWFQPTTFACSEAFSSLEPAALVEEARAALHTLGGEPSDLDRDRPHEALAAWAPAVLPALAVATVRHRRGAKA